jgi:hypothetical protein
MRRWPVASAPAGAAPTAEASVAPPARRPLFSVITTVAAAVAAACAGHAVPAATAPVGVDPAREAAAARAVVQTFIAAEARGDEAADTLLAPGADFINSGVAVALRPRLAAVLGRGEATVESLRTQVSGQLAWCVAVYRWSGQGGQIEERGRATLVLERHEAGWRIRHVHSSAVPPW